MCATGAQKAAQQQEADIAKTQATINKTMSEDFKTVFGQNQNILTSLMSAVEPIVSAGVGQFGFTPQEEASMRTEASDQATQAAQQSEIASSAKEAARGGSAFTPSGADAQINAMVNEQSKLQEAQAQEAITQKGFATGRENYFNALGVESAAPGALEGASSNFANAVTGSGNAAVGGSQAAMEGATQIAQANQAWMAPVFGAIGGVLGGALSKGGVLGGALSKGGVLNK